MNGLNSLSTRAAASLSGADSGPQVGFVAEIFDPAPLGMLVWAVRLVSSSALIGNDNEPECLRSIQSSDASGAGCQIYLETL